MTTVNLYGTVTARATAQTIVGLTVSPAAQIQSASKLLAWIGFALGARTSASATLTAYLSKVYLSARVTARSAIGLGGVRSAISFLSEAADSLTASGTIYPLPLPTGSSADIVARVKRLIPKGWFAFVAPVRDAILGGLADSAAWGYSLIQYTKSQTRIATMSGIWLDLAALDFFGRALRRGAGQSDSAFKARVQAELLRERVTRAGMSRMITDLTGVAPWIFEPWNTGDTGAWDTGQSIGFDTFGGWGDTCLPAQTFIVVTPPGLQGIPGAPGFDTGAMGWDTGTGEWADESMITGSVTDQDIYDATNRTRPTGSLVWMQFGPLPTN